MMRNLIRYLLFVILLFILNEQSYGINNRCDSLKNILFSDYFKVKFRDNLVEIIVDELISENCSENEQTLYRFSVENKLYQGYSLSKMAECKMHSFITFLYKYGDSLDSPAMYTCLVSLNKKELLANDSLLDYITHVATNYYSAGIRSIALYRLSISARFKDCQILKEKIALEPDENVLIDYYRTFVRFSSEKIDSLVSKFILIISKFDRRFFNNLEEYNRYDFLPELYTLRKRLKKEENPLKKKDATEMLIKLEEVLPILEKKKAEKAPIGLPLDWGVEKEDGKEKIRNK